MPPWTTASQRRGDSGFGDARDRATHARSWVMRATMPDEAVALPIRELEVLPFLPPPRSVLDEVMASLSRRVRVPCRLRRAAERVEIAHLPGRDQADADDLLSRLEQVPAPEGNVLVGLTRVDIGHAIFTYFFGRARRHGRAVLVSAARLDPTFYGLPEDPSLTARRIVLEIVHELGHTMGLDHCEDFGCVMRFAPTVEAIDVRGTTFCASCRADLGV